MPFPLDAKMINKFNPKILIVGYGVVGKAIAKSLSPYYNLAIKDKNLFLIDDTNVGADAVIICVNADTTENGDIDTTNLEQALSDVKNSIGEKPIMVKTTLPPNIVKTLLPKNAIYSPEFLRSASAYEDFQDQKFMILGGATNIIFWKNVFQYLDATFIETTAESASWAKYLHNSYLASKVSWFHEMAYVSKKLNEENNFDKALKIIGHYDDTIGNTHLYAPNAEGTYGYSGGCFPKDMKAFQKYTDSKLLKMIMEYNNEQQQHRPT